MRKMMGRFAADRAGSGRHLRRGTMHLDRTFMAAAVVACLLGTVAIGSGCSVQTSEHVPRLDLVESDGCVDVFVFKTNAERSEFLLVGADVEELELERGVESSFDLERRPPGLEVRVDVYAAPPPSPMYCSDIVSEERPIARWTAVAGRVSITLREGTRGRQEGDRPLGTYRAVVVVDDLTLEDESGRRVATDASIEIAADVGWIPG